MEEKEVRQHIEKIEKLINSADKFNEISFRMVLEGLVSKVGEEAEYFIIHYFNNTNLESVTRINIIRVAGYIQSPHFLIPLKKIIDTDENIYLRKEAIISVSKYNDRLALNILNQALNSIKNPLLQETIINEIGKIKRNNPVIALIPRFLEGEKNLKEFNITLEILKRIVSPADAPMFVAYLNCGRRTIEDGAFEILCFTADEKLQEQILNFFQDRFNEMSFNQEELSQKKEEIENQRLYSLVVKIKFYFLRNPSLIDQNLENLGTQLFYIKEKRIRDIFITIICRSQHPASISFISSLYDNEPDLRRNIAQNYYGNEAAMDLLFEKYQNAGDELKTVLIRSLLNCRRGLEYFYLHFPSLEAKEKEIIVVHLPYGGNHDLSRFFLLVMQSNQPELQTLLLKKVKDHYEFSVKDILFNPLWQKQFSLTEGIYLDTAMQLFPISSVKMLMEKIIGMELSVSQANRYLKKMKDVVLPGFSFTISDKGFITLLFNKIIQFNNPEIGALFLSILKDIKTFDLQTYYNFHESLGLFTAQQERKIGQNEAEELRKARKNLNDLYYEIQRLEEGVNLLNRLFSRETIDIEQVADFLKRHPLCAALNIQRLTLLVSLHLQESKPPELKQWIQFFYRFPLLGILIRDAILEKIHLHKNPLEAELTKLYQSLPPEPYKLVIYLGNHSFTAGLKDQCSELIPMIPTSTSTDGWQEGDILVCDPENLKEFILKHTLPSKKLFLLLEKRTDISSFKSYNARPLIQPFSIYRVFKEILKEVFI